MSTCSRIAPPERIALKQTVPVTLLVFGEGDGTGLRKGNLQQEGVAQRGQESRNPLDDASTAASSKTNAATVKDPTQTANLVPTSDVGKRGKEKDDAEAAEFTIGRKDGDDLGTGIGWAGAGKGKGTGYGDIDWGGGGNRVVLTKVLPSFPSGTLNTQVKIKFRVLADGKVSMAWPVRRGGNPAVDQAAVQAMMQWRFNPLAAGSDMEGTITFVFRNS
ncbi:MAG: energy transducer TonB [Candidatus Kapabacteria bacterium]|nr:energy transducer TonB [Candidatus Kapabacteria bacterium]